MDGLPKGLNRMDGVRRRGQQCRRKRFFKQIASPPPLSGVYFWYQRNAPSFACSQIVRAEIRLFYKRSYECSEYIYIALSRLFFLLLFVGTI